MASGDSGSSVWNRNPTRASSANSPAWNTYTQSSSLSKTLDECSPASTSSPWSGCSTHNAAVKSLKDVMKEQQTEISTEVNTLASKDDYKFVSSEPWYPGKVNRDKKRRDVPFASRSTSGSSTSGKKSLTSTTSQDIYPEYETLSKQTGIQVANLHRKDLIIKGYKNLEEWVKVPGHVYIGRDMTHYVPGAVGSKWHNPFKSKYGTREQSCEQFKAYIRTNKNIHDNGKTLYESLDELKGKTLGCWCHPERCHGHMLMELVSEVCG